MYQRNHVTGQQSPGFQAHSRQPLCQYRFTFLKRPKVTLMNNIFHPLNIRNHGLFHCQIFLLLLFCEYWSKSNWKSITRLDQCSKCKFSEVKRMGCYLATEDGPSVGLESIGWIIDECNWIIQFIFSYYLLAYISYLLTQFLLQIKDISDSLNLAPPCHCVLSSVCTQIYVVVVEHHCTKGNQ